MNTRVFLDDRTVYDIQVDPYELDRAIKMSDHRLNTMLQFTLVGFSVATSVWINAAAISSFHAIEAR